MKKTALALTSILALLLLTAVGPRFVTFSSANFTTPPPELPYTYITADGRVEPQTSSIQRVGETYIFTGDMINQTLVIERNNVVVDGAGYSIQGNGSGKGVILTDIANITIKGITMRDLAEGVVCKQSSGNSISNNTIIDCQVAIHFISAPINIIVGNSIARTLGAIVLYGSSNNSIIENQIKETRHDGITLDVGYESTLYSNLTLSNYCSIIKNNITSSLDVGIKLFASSYSRVEENFVSGSENGIYLYGSLQQNSIANNTIVNNTQGITLMADSDFNNVTGNHITNNKCGVFISGSNKNLLFHNNFINNQRPVCIDPLQYLAPHIPSSANTWDDGGEGNFWSNYTGIDADGDGIGETSYVIDADNIDHYPLAKPMVTPSSLDTELKQAPFPTVPVIVVSGSAVAVAAVAALVYLKKHKREAKAQ